MFEKHRRWIYPTGGFIFLVSLTVVLQTNRTATTWLFVGYGILFLSYLLLSVTQFEQWLFPLGLLARGLTFFTLPLLSDDIYRFLWDGYLTNAGIHPFAELPESHLNKSIPGISEQLFERLNSKEYFSIYPPINQGLFWLSVQFSTSWLVATNVLRICLLMAEIGTYHLLRRSDSSVSRLSLYWLNPLIIIEGLGNLHMEILVIFFLAWGLRALSHQRHFQVGLALALAAGTKLVPVILAPYMLFRGFYQRRLLTVLVFVAAFVVTLLPLFSPAFITGMQSSLDLYFRRFEFNASIYFLARWMGYGWRGYNEIAHIGPLLGGLSFLSIWTLSLVGVFKNWTPGTTMLYAFSIYLLFATTVHPWYILPLIFLGVWTHRWYPIVWSGMIFLTYAGYGPVDYQINLGWVILEYAVVGLVFIFESKNKKWWKTT